MNLACHRCSDVSPLSRTVALVPSCNLRTSAMNFLGQPNFVWKCYMLSAIARLYTQCQTDWCQCYLRTALKFGILVACNDILKIVGAFQEQIIIFRIIYV